MERHIVAIGLLTEQEVNLLGERFTRLWPVDNAPKFEELLEAIDDADRRLAEARRHEMKAGPTPE
ncbi:MAG TPA: hypothetical protein VIJ81_09150 [Sphingomicrobium sp.]|nr:hypothetical protein [Sphingomicrobium sp.]